MRERKQLAEGAWLVYEPGWLGPDEADALLEALVAEVAWEARAIVAFGREIPQPRLMGWGGELPYRYSGQTLPPRALAPAVVDLQRRVSEEVGERFNHVVLNRYRDGRDHMAFHADDEPELGRNPVIAALSLGMRRRFVLSRKRRRGYKRTLWLGHGSLLVMGGTMQHTWRHAVPKHPGDGERVNVTFRFLHGPPGWRPSRSVTERGEPRPGPGPEPDRRA